MFTALLAWFVFDENFDRRIAAGMVLIVVGGLVLSWSLASFAVSPGALLIAGACLCWAIDNNLTHKVSGNDAMAVARIEGLIAGAVNIGVAVLKERLRGVARASEDCRYHVAISLVSGAGSLSPLAIHCGRYSIRARLSTLESGIDSRKRYGRSKEVWTVERGVPKNVPTLFCKPLCCTAFDCDGEGARMP